MSAYEIRPFASLEEYRACVALQEEVWGEGFSERVSVAILKVSQRLGGIAAGAYDEEEELAGFVFGMTGVEEHEVVHWSDMLAVREEHRGRGLGFWLKAYQRHILLERGIERVYWTFDPLEAKNAYLNLSKLGALVREYEVNMYGETDSPLHRGIGTDRFVALWLLDSGRVRDRMTPQRAGTEEGGDSSVGLDPSGAEAVLEAEPGDGIPLPGSPRLGLGPEAGVLSVAIPAEIQELKACSPGGAAKWREATRAVLVDYLSKGWQVSEVVRMPGEPVARYLLEPRTPSQRGSR